MNTETLDSDRLIQEARANLALGLVDESERQVDQYIEAVGEDARSLELRRKIACSRGDYQAAADIVKVQPGILSDSLTAMHEVNISGDPAWAYSNCLLMENARSRDPSYWFNRACFASRAGAFPDAPLSLIRSFRLSTTYHADAFLDPDFDALWTWMEEAPQTDENVEILAHWSWARALYSIDTAGHELTLTPLMHPRVPEKFLPFLPVGTVMNGIYALPTMPADLYREYLEWQMATAGANAQRIRLVLARAREKIAASQVRFAFWQAKNGNPTAARYHVLQHLAMGSDGISRLQGLRELGMGALLDDIAPAIEEDNSFAERIQAAHLGMSHEKPREWLEGIGPLGKTTAIFKLRLASLEIESGHAGEAIPLVTEVIRAWPDDAAAYSRLTDLFIFEGRWEEARVSFNASPRHYERFWRQATQLQMIATEDHCAQSADSPSCDIFYGQRDLGGTLRPEFFPGGGYEIAKSAQRPG